VSEWAQNKNEREKKQALETIWYGTGKAHVAVVVENVRTPCVE
jgi:hypothetical protein